MYVAAACSGDRRDSDVLKAHHLCDQAVPVESVSVAHTRIGKSCPELLPRWDAAVVRKNAAVLFDFLQRLSCSRYNVVGPWVLLLSELFIQV
jgi:hypothetical protein